VMQVASEPDEREPDAAVPDAAVPSWPVVVSLLPGIESFGVVSAACPAELTPADLPDLIVAADRLISHLQAVQVTAVAEFSLPGRSGSMGQLIDGLVDKTGLADRGDGTFDAFSMHCLIQERAQSMAAAEIGAALHQSPHGAARR
jgi:hypothetical protein